ncbi:hypothetical protein AWENTII_012483 [Aspergillus wentii]
MAGKSPGDVGFWNSHFRIGGAVGSKVETECGGSVEKCKAAWGLLHLTGTSSVYIENMWGWTADHDLDGQNKQNIATGRGLLVEATKGTWLVGTGFEHHALYQYNFEHAQNVFSALQQSETPYWQGPGNALAPAPWADSLTSSDPNYSGCAAMMQPAVWPYSNASTARPICSYTEDATGSSSTTTEDVMVNVRKMPSKSWNHHIYISTAPTRRVRRT